MEFEWDERKSYSNFKKHGVTFEEARTVFIDDYALLIGDPDHSLGCKSFVIVTGKNFSEKSD